MGLSVIQPTNFESPDTVLGGLAVTSPTNTGHAQTNTSAGGGTSEAKSCRWFGFQAAPVLLRRTLKVTHVSDGFRTGGGANSYRLSYSLNGGSNWTDAVSRVNFTSAQGPTTFSLDLDPSQDTSQIQVRDNATADTADVGDGAQVLATVSDIKIELLSGDLID